MKSFYFAFRGIFLLFKNERNAIIHLIIGSLVVLVGWAYNIKDYEWAIVSVCIAAVLAAEAFNTCIEMLCNKISVEKDDLIGRIKDISAGAVLIISLGAATAGCYVFIPHIMKYI